MNGKLYYGVTTTRIFCRFGCPSKTPNPSNVLYFETLDQARESGFRSCKRCRPELTQSPTAAFQQFVIEQLLQIESTNPGDTIQDLARKLHLSKRQLERIVKVETGLTPKKFLREKKKDYEI